MKSEPCVLYIGGVRVRCTRLEFEGEATEIWADIARQAAEESRAPLAMTRRLGSAPSGWVSMPRSYGRPSAAEPEALEPLTEADHAAMRGLYGLFAGLYPGMLARENPATWEERFDSLPNPLGLFDGGRLLLWLAERDGELLELSAAPDALHRVPGALLAAGVTRAPAPLLGTPAEWVEESVKLLLLRPFHIPGHGIETPEALTRALDGAVQWD